MSLEHWEHYYRGGALVSCPTSDERNYTQEVRDAWSEFFSGLPDGARILDIGCGNGPLSLIAQAAAAESNRHFEIDAVDLAEIDPPADVPDGESIFAGIRFHAGVSTEALPFDDASMDAVCGQYILEYTEENETLMEIARVLKPQGRCQLIVHHDESLIVGNARESLDHAEFVLQELKVLRRLRRYLESLRESPARMARAKAELLDAGRQLKAAAGKTENPLFLVYVMNSVNSLLRHQASLGRGEMLRHINRLERELKDWVCRLNDLNAGARSRAEMAKTAALMEGVGFEHVELAEQFQETDRLVGWRLNSRRSGRVRA